MHVLYSPVRIAGVAATSPTPPTTAVPAHSIPFAIPDPLFEGVVPELSSLLGSFFGGVSLRDSGPGEGEAPS